MKKKMLLFIALMAILGVNKAIAQPPYATNASGYTVSIYPGASATLSLIGDEDGYAIWTSVSHGLFGTDAILIVTEPDRYRKIGKASGGVETPFNVRIIQDPDEIHVTDNGDGTATISGINVFFTLTGSNTGSSILYQQDGTTIVDYNQILYTVPYGTYRLKTGDGYGGNPVGWLEIDANFSMTSQYTITLSANPSTGGSVSGGGTFDSGTSRTVTATPNALFTFANWTEGGSPVSTSASYTFTLSTNRTLVANFQAKSNNANLSALSVSIGTLTPAFNATTTSYTVSVANSVTSLTISATAAHTAATVTGTGVKTLSVGANPFEIKVTAEDGTIKTYLITVTREAAVTTPALPIFD